MAHVIEVKDGQVATVKDLDDVLLLISEHMGTETRDWLEDYLAEATENDEYLKTLEDDLKETQEKYKTTMKELRKQSEKLARLIRKKDIDREALSHIAGGIGTITWREMR